MVANYVKKGKVLYYIMSAYFEIDFVSKKNPEIKITMFSLSTSEARELDEEKNFLFDTPTKVDRDFLIEIKDIYSAQAKTIKTNIEDSEDKIKRAIEIMKNTPSIEVYNKNVEEIEYLEGYKFEAQKELDHKNGLADQIQTIINIYDDNKDYSIGEFFFDIEYVYE